MIKTKDCRSPYYIYDCWKNQIIGVFETFDALIERLKKDSREVTPWWSSKTEIKNDFIDNYNCTGKDTIYYCDGDTYSTGHWEYVLRRWMVFDKNNSIIDIRNYKKDILKIEKRKYRWYRGGMKEKDLPEFRRGPVPYTGHYKHYRFYRSPKTRNEFRQNTDAEYKEFVRPNRRKLPTAWDEIVRDTPKCWKDQSKKRKQWM